MTDYKDTLNLPTTDFAMKANLAQREPALLAHWESIDIYTQLRSARKGKPLFILHDGPPYANGNIHIGHAVNKILKDIVIKAKTLSGFDAPYVPGWDCHGLPIELNVEKKLGKAGHKVTHREFRKACRDYAEQQVNIQREEFKRLGVLGDWDNPYLTMNFNFEANIIRALAKIIDREHLYQGRKPVHWCIECSSALAEAEVEYENKTSLAIDVRFVAVDPATFISRCTRVANDEGKGPIVVPIWTTTPWTLPANQAVALNPLLDYVLIQYESETRPERLLCVETLLESVLARYGIQEHTVVARCVGSALEGLQLQHPFYERTVPVVLGDHVTVDAGTGAVHTAPGHGQDDYAIGIKYGLPIDNPVGSNGCFLADTPLFAGEHILKVNDHIIDVLKQHHSLLHQTTVQHSYPHCWRHKTPLVFLATPQWFISMDHCGLRQEALSAIKQVQWLPEWGQARITGMIAQRPDWCISRQRAWSVPMPLFVHKQTRKLHPDTIVLMEKIAARIEQEGIDAWFELDPKTVLGNEADNYDKVSDTLDVWFDSGVTHACVLEKNPALAFPADLYLEGSDQHRGWFHSSLLSSVAMHGVAPYRAVLTHGFAVDAKGRKMSKSLGNVVAPEKVVNSLGADVLRLWVASTDYRAEMAVSDEILKRTSDAYRRIRNTARFLLANLHGFDPLQHTVKPEKMLALDRWAVDHARLLQAELQQAYEQFNFHLIYQKVHHFCAMDMGSFYLDVIKDRQYTTQENSLARRSAQTAMYHIAEALVRWIAPVLSFTAEEIWQCLPDARESSVLLTTWYETLFNLPADDPMGQAYWEQVMHIRDAVNKELERLRSAGTIGSALQAEVSLYVSPSLQTLLTALGDELRFVLITSRADVLPETQRSNDVVETEIPGLWLKIQASLHAKCVRCWHYRADAGRDKTHPELCARCVDNVTGKGEVRHFA